MVAKACLKTTFSRQISVDFRLTNCYHIVPYAEEPPSEYWQILAEQRRQALAETLKENEELYTELAGVKKHVNELESKVKDLEYFAMMYTLASKDDSQL